MPSKSNHQRSIEESSGVEGEALASGGDGHQSDSSIDIGRDRIRKIIAHREELLVSRRSILKLYDNCCDHLEMTDAENMSGTSRMWWLGFSCALEILSLGAVDANVIKR